MKGRMNDNGLMDFLDFNQRILNALLTFCVQLLNKSIYVFQVRKMVEQFNGLEDQLLNGLEEKKGVDFLIKNE